MARAPSIWDPWVWPLAATMRFGEAAFRVLVHPEGEPEPPGSEIAWATPHDVVLDLPATRLHDFSTHDRGPATLILAPFALHRASVADFAPGHSLVQHLAGHGIGRLQLVECKSATPGMKDFVIDTYLAELAVIVCGMSGPVNLIGLCQGGWLALMFAARFPGKVARLVLAGAPVDFDAGSSTISSAARATSPGVFEAIVQAGEGRVLGRKMLGLWGGDSGDPAAIDAILQRPAGGRAELAARFAAWNGSTVDLPGAYYLEVVEHLFRNNRLAAGTFHALGRVIDPAAVTIPVHLLASQDDAIAPPPQVLAVRGLVGTPPGDVRALVTHGPHLSLFMGADTLAGEWRAIAAWLAAPRRRARPYAG